MTLPRLFRPLAVLIALTCTAATAAESVIYKVRYADGSIGFTDSPPRDATILERRTVGGSANAVAAPAPRPSAAERASARPAPPPAASGAAPTDLGSAWQEINEAQSALDEARRALETGREPLPGERLGLVGGGSRLSPAYEERLRGLEESVAAAELRLNEAHAARNAAR